MRLGTDILRGGLLRLALILGILVFIASGGSVLATSFSGTGAGTAEKPYQIATCNELQDIANNPSAYYELTGNIDCSATTSWNSGTGFVPITSFTGTLDGQNFTVSSLYENTGSSASALFVTTSGATIKNIHLVGGAYHDTNTSYNGSFAAYANGTVFSNCSSSISILSDAGAGLVGNMSGGSMTDCWYGGTVTSSSSYGSGLVSVDTNTVFTNVYTTGSVSETGPYAAGLIGNISGTASVTNAYSTSHVTAGVGYSGGLFAIATNSGGFQNVFYAGQYDQGLTTGSPFVGTGSGYGLLNAYYDATLCGCGTGGSGGNPVNIGNTAPNYFLGNNTNQPMSAWNFSTVWQTNTGGYPTLRLGSLPVDSDSDGSSSMIENAGPNGGDANNDGIADSAESNVTSVVDSVGGKYAVLQSNCDSNSGVSATAAPSGAYADANFEYPLGVMNFTLNCGTPGITATVVQYYYTDMSPNGLVVRKYNPSSHSYQAIPGAVITQVTIGGQKALKVVYQITDGGPFDEDGTANGTIVDPSGIALANVTAPNTGYGVVTNNPIRPLATGGAIAVVLIAAAAAIRKRTISSKR